MHEHDAPDGVLRMSATRLSLRRTLKRVLREMAYDADRDQKHLKDLEDWIFQATEDEMEEDYDTTVASYLEACLDDGETIDENEVMAYLDELLENSDGVDLEGDLVIHIDALDARDY